jgi:hypothetical protein
MFGGKKEAAPEMVQPVDVETYAVATGAERIRALEAEITACFEEWMKAQKSSAEKHVLVEFSMSPWLSAAWSSWKAHKFASPTDSETGIIPLPDKWPS